MVILEIDFKSLNDKIVNIASSPSLSQPKTWESDFLDPVAFFLRGFREREREHFSLDLHTRTNRWLSSGQEEELLYAGRASRGYQICEFLKNSER